MCQSEYGLIACRHTGNAVRSVRSASARRSASGRWEVRCAKNDILARGGAPTKKKKKIVPSFCTDPFTRPYNNFSGL